jgi:heavy metal sensor kinase
MRSRLSIGSRLILTSWSLALGCAVLLTLAFFVRTRHQLLQQLEKTLETKCDEVITVLESEIPHPTLEEFLRIETNYRFTPYTFFYQIADGSGEILAKSENLGEGRLPLPRSWELPARGNPLSLLTGSCPASVGRGMMRLRSERVPVSLRGRDVETLVIQTGVSLAPLEAATRRYLLEGVLYAASGLAAGFLLLWFVTTRSLRPVSAITRKASQITGSNPSERLPITGSGDELDELAKVLNDMLDRLEGSLRQIEQFSSDAAHQLRTPLTRIRGELDLVLRGEVTDPVKGQLERVQGEVERLSRLCGRLLLLSRLDRKAEHQKLLDERVDVGAVVGELLEQVGPMAHERGVEIRYGPRSSVSVRGSRPLLVEALLNLLDNAIRFTPRGGKVEVSIEQDDGHVRLSVADTGVGIPPEERERIFQRFYRIPRASADPPDGTGLGLAIVRGIAQAHGGRVELEPRPSGGSVFTIVLPG